MSKYEELQQFVASIANDAQSKAMSLLNCADSIEKYVSLFSHLTSTTQGRSAKTVEMSFISAQKQVLIAANALIEAGKAGSEWSGSSVPELKRVLTKRRR